jgi:hypothetical protein
MVKVSNSAVLKRIKAEVKAELKSLDCNKYDRTHNRHNR